VGCETKQNVSQSERTSKKVRTHLGAERRRDSGSNSVGEVTTVFVGRGCSDLNVGT
jgi:hypothetical protein